MGMGTSTGGGIVSAMNPPADEAAAGEPAAAPAARARVPTVAYILMGVVEPLTLMHAPNESVDPNEIASMALAEALFLRRYAATR
jgi:acetylornithine deacetylase/succinyl-diaminopimelate desuccinylase-like protein